MGCVFFETYFPSTIIVEDNAVSVCCRPGPGALAKKRLPGRHSSFNKVLVVEQWDLAKYRRVAGWGKVFKYLAQRKVENSRAD